jgi:hypothetical protein
MRTRVLMLVVAVTLATVGIEATAQSPTAAIPSPSTSETVQEVTVTARRLNIAPAVREFVNQIADFGNGEELVRWDTPMCPTVMGLPREEVEFILGRIAEIAQAARVPMAGKSCNPNLYIVVVAHPKVLLEAWYARNSIRLGVFNGATWRHDLNGAPPSVVEPFINTPRAARVWYYTGASDTWPALSVAAGPMLESNRLQSHIAYGFFRVFVIADQTRLKGLTIGQFADYVSMVSLAQIKPDARLGDTPTILKLFDGVPPPTPASVTNWDRAFLKSLYGTDQQAKTQRSLMTDDMVRDIPH